MLLSHGRMTNLKKAVQEVTDQISDPDVCVIVCSAFLAQAKRRASVLQKF